LPESQDSGQEKTRQETARFLRDVPFLSNDHPFFLQPRHNPDDCIGCRFSYKLQILIPVSMIKSSFFCAQLRCLLVSIMRWLIYYKRIIYQRFASVCGFVRSVGA
jgi:hypothetical protein